MMRATIAWGLNMGKSGASVKSELDRPWLFDAFLSACESNQISVMVLKSYDQLLSDTAGKNPYLLLGNGFSIGCNPVFKYDSLYKTAVSFGLSTRVQALFERLGTNNFEAVMKLLNDSDWVAREYGLLTGKSELIDDKEILKKALIKAVSKTHLEDAGWINKDKRAAASRFLSDYHSVFTTNYDLLLYWMVMTSDEPIFEDGFRNDPDDPNSLIFSERVGDVRRIYFLHGALHLFHEDGVLKKHSWSKTGTKLTRWVQIGLEAERYPLFVAEGDSKKKLEQIERSGYLWHCLQKLSRIQRPLVVYGHSLKEADQHIIDSIADNFQLEQIYIGLRDPEGSTGLVLRKTAADMQQRRKSRYPKKPLAIDFFDSTTAEVWGDSE